MWERRDRHDADRCLVLPVLDCLCPVRGTGVALFLVLHPAVDKEDTGNVQREYTAPSYARTAGFAIQTHPDSEILHPRRFWLVNDGTAEIEYVITPNHFAGCAPPPPVRWICRTIF